jgi:hypothetical protein
MKNSTLFLFICLFLNSIVTLAGNKGQNRNAGNSVLNRVITPSVSTVSFSSFYSEDFAGGLPSGWQAIDSAGNGVNWYYTTTWSADSSFLNATGTSAANGYMLIDSDSAGNSVGGENADLISGVINCSAKSSVRLNFNEYLKHFNDTATVWVSNDGATWTEVHNSSSVLPVYGSTANPNNVDVDISSVAANQDTVYIRFNYRADYSYYWMIDDVMLYETPSQDASITDIVDPSTSCTMLTATEPVIVNIYNNGGSTINGGLSVSFVLNNGTPVTENVTDSIVAGGTLVYTFTATADLSMAGSHSILAYVSLTNDTVQSNDTVSESLYNGPHPVNSTSTYSNGFETDADLIGLITEDSNTDSITFEVSNVLPKTGAKHMLFTGPIADDWFFTTCLKLDSGTVYNLKFYHRKTSSTSQVNLQVMIGNIQSAGGMSQEILPFTTINTLAYQEVIVVFSAYLTDTYYIGFHINDADSLVGYALDDIWVGPDSAVGIEKIGNSSLSLYPNPSTGIFYINSNENISGEFTVEVLNQVGQEVFSSPANTLNNFEINLQEQPAGVYLMRILSEKGVITRKISITH